MLEYLGVIKATYFFKNLDEGPLGALGRVVCCEDDDVLALGTDCNFGAVSIIGKAVNTRSDSVFSSYRLVFPHNYYFL